MDRLQEKIGYKFKNEALIENALTHSSYANENRHTATSNERLEFLGDAVLGLVTAKYFFTSRPDWHEGNMTRLRAELVCERNLTKVAAALSLGDFLRLGRGEQAGGALRPSILADATEALIAAIYLDGGMSAAEEFIRKFILVPYEAGEMGKGRDYKTELQETVQRKSGQTIEYRLMSENGPDHAKIFCVEVLLNGRSVGIGMGPSKKIAEQAAANDALEGMK